MFIVLSLLFHSTFYLPNLSMLRYVYVLIHLNFCVVLNCMSIQNSPLDTFKHNRHSVKVIFLKKRARGLSKLFQSELDAFCTGNTSVILRIFLLPFLYWVSFFLYFLSSSFWVYSSVLVKTILQ